MNNEAITKFTETVAADPELQKEVQSIQQAAARQTAEKLAALSVEAGTPFTAEEFLASVTPASAELSEEQLESVAGGTWAPSEGNVMLSIFTLGAGCLIAFNASLAFKNDPDGCQADGKQPRRSGGYD
jgi:predicted ribosomally synthesized peptide with nif11-like leader